MVLAIFHDRETTEFTLQPESQAPFRFDDSGALLETKLPFPRRQGKVRDVYDLGDSLLIVSTDRISAFDFILPSGIPRKGVLLTAMSRFWFDFLEVDHHLISTEVPSVVAESVTSEPLAGRIMQVRKAEVVPFECVVRGYLEGSGWREYQTSGSVCAVDLPKGLRQCDALPSPMFTPATKAEEGHDENVSLEVMTSAVGQELATQLKQRSLSLYEQAAAYAAGRGIIIADTKFEFGHPVDRDGQVDRTSIMLIDEVLTPDSSRFWAQSEYQPGHPQPSFDKQFVREWLSQCGWDKNSPPPALPDEITQQTAAKYIESYERLTGLAFAG
ncbi:MAG: phosphoribosylaminoimidazolesuccinocarboxamide synthase [Planctomycetota bacterium]